jgi:type IV secretory pathway VirB10-like protein
MLDNTAGMFGQDQSADKRASQDSDADGAAARTPSANTGDSGDRVAQLIRAQAAGQAPRDHDRDWLKEYSQLKPTRAITPMRVKNPFTLIQGKVIPAVLGKTLNSDLPGDITAFTTMDIWDSLSGKNLLIPKGSMLVGEYSNRVRPGQDRLMFAFSRIVLPNGISFDLPGNKGEDQTGASGVSGDVNNHYFKRFTSGILIALLADKLESGNTQPVTNIGTTGGPNTAAGKVLSEIATADLGRNKDIPPTITVPKGTRINVQVSADMEFPSPYINRSKL